MPVDSIDAIKRRMIRNASKIWGFQDAQDINAFDPVLSLIIGALSEELYKISHQINQADARVVEKFLELLFNQNIFSHFPAHALAKAKPQQARVEINEKYQFYLEKTFQGKKEGTTEKKSMYFTPTGKNVLFNANIKYLCAGKSFYEIDGTFKEKIADIPPGPNINYSKLFLGIEIDPLAEKLDGLSLYFSFKNLKKEEQFYQQLNSATWKINGYNVEFEAGKWDGIENDTHSLFEIIKKGDNISHKTVSFINEYYRKRIVKLAQGNHEKKQFTKEQTFPDVIKSLIDNKAIQFESKNVLWVEIDFPQPLIAEDINDLSVSMNCFPVINRELNELSFSVSKGTNVIPLNTEDLFFDIQRVSNSADLEYRPKTSMNENEKNTYILRQGGIARFDSRDARETISNLLELVRDEAGAFSSAGTDLISIELKELDQTLSRLEQRLNKLDVVNDLNSYIILESKTNFDKVLVEFWSIAGEAANNIRPGTKLSVYRGVDLNEKEISLMTQTVGGKQKLNKEDKLNTLRSALLSKGRVVTVEDIKALCFEHFGETLNAAEVKKGVSVNPLPGKGMTRTLDIYLTLNKENNLGEEELHYLVEGLKVKLKQNSLNFLPYRVFI